MKKAGRSVVHLIISVLLLVTFGPVKASGQTHGPAPPNETQQLIDRAEESYRKGVEASARGQAEEARKYFDQAIDVILLSDKSIAATPGLEAYYRELLDKIHKTEAQPGDKHEAQVQEPEVVEVNEPSVLDELSGIKEDELATVTPGGIKIFGKYDFDFSVAPPVFQFLNFFVSGRGRSTMETGLKRSGRYRQMAEKIFKEERVPLDLIWLAQAESVWKPNALSHAAAKGIWQFVPSTGTQYGLAQTQWVDDRSHPEKSTRAAARYLRFLHDHFAGDWLLAMAAYNSGENRVDRIIARLGYADFWEIHKRGLLPQETRNYVPIILSIIIVSKNQKRYGFHVQPDPPSNYDTYDVSTQTDLKVAADLIGVPYESLQDLNPELRRGVTPPDRAYSLKLPKGMKKQFEVAYAALPEDQRVRKIVVPVAVAESYRPSRPSYRGSSYRAQAASYQVKGGDTLAALARRHGVSVSDLARANGMAARGKLRKGQSIRIPGGQSLRASKGDRKSVQRSSRLRASSPRGRAGRYVEKKAVSSRAVSRKSARDKKQSAAPARSSRRRR